MFKNKIITIISSTLIILGLLILGFSGYFFHVAETRGKKSFIGTGELSKNNVLYQKQQDWSKLKSSTLKIKTHDGLRLTGQYVPADKKTKKTVVVIHGFGGNHKTTAPFGEMFHEMGYNVLMADNRSSGESEGKYIGYGFLEAKDYLNWIQKIIKMNGKDSQIVVMGASMGGATTMMLSGMNPPEQVKAFIEDSGYTSVFDELHYQAADMYKLPGWLSNIFIPVMSTYSRVLAGYSYSEANAVKLLHNNSRPMLFIQGDNDKIVPSKDINIVYNASKGPKTKYIAKGAGHVESYQTAPQKYESTVENFLDNYFR